LRFGSIVGAAPLMVCLSLSGFFVLGVSVMSKLVKVFHGDDMTVYGFAGQRVSDVRKWLTDTLCISKDANTTVNGRRVPGTYVLREHDALWFPSKTVDKASPDIATMSLDELAVFVTGELGSLKQAEERALLQSQKSAVHLYWAGCALSKAKELCEVKGIEEWKQFKTEHSLPDTTVNEAIRLFKNAKTPEALTGMGITEAKNKFVFHERKPISPKSTASKPLAQGKAKPIDGKSDKTTAPIDEVGHSDAGELTEPADEIEYSDVSDPTDPVDEVEHSEASDPTEAVVGALNDVAQQLNEIAQDQLGKADLQNLATARVNQALKAVSQAVTKIRKRIGHD
jgi:stage V sporulation protein SpoVS